uniref:hypothetical protein n=1 Tax=Enterocloster hominis (ex Hitch et al. 2024) TaxID=1917870 RepID=UPI0010302D51|nr:hypothetical protein [Lachnoclostridium pacaense]
MKKIRGIDFVLGADLVFSPEDSAFMDSDIIATCFGAREKFLYSDDGRKTITQIGWTYTVYVPERDLMINISVEDHQCAIDREIKSPQEVRFTNFRATFYVSRDKYLELSCKADKAELVAPRTAI